MTHLKIIVIGVTHHNTLGMVRCLGKAGYGVDYLVLTDGKDDSFVTYSRYVKKAITIKGDDCLLDILLGLKRDASETYVIISCTDGAAHILDVNYEILKEHFHFFNSGESGLMTNYMNKKIQTVLAEKAGLSIPWSKELANVGIEMAYPCILKPVQSINGGKQIIICKNELEFTKGKSTFDDGVEVLVQEFIKKESEIVVLGVSTQGGISIPGYIQKHREHDGGTTYSSVFDISSLPVNILNGCKKLVSSMHYTGLFGIEFLISGGNYYFVEINLRNDATTYALAVAGVNLPQLYINSLVDAGEYKEIGKVKHITSIVEYNDFKHRHESGVSFLLWLRQYIGAKCKYYFCLSDPLPFFYAPFK